MTLVETSTSLVKPHAEKRQLQYNLQSFFAGKKQLALQQVTPEKRTQWSPEGAGSSQG